MIDKSDDFQLFINSLRSIVYMKSITAQMITAASRLSRGSHLLPSSIIRSCITRLTNSAEGMQIRTLITGAMTGKAMAVPEASDG